MTDKQMRNAIDRRLKAFDGLLLTVLKQIQVWHDFMKCTIQSFNLSLFVCCLSVWVA